MVVIYLTNKVCALVKKTSSWMSLIAPSLVWRWCWTKTRKRKRRSMYALIWAKRNIHTLQRRTSRMKLIRQLQKSEKTSRKIIKPKTLLHLTKMIWPLIKLDRRYKKCFLIRQLKKVKSKQEKKIPMKAINLMKVLKNHKKNTQMVIFQSMPSKTKTQKLKNWRAGATRVKNNSAL